jgi:predicted phage terminase large subunit-like protein
MSNGNELAALDAELERRRVEAENAAINAELARRKLADFLRQAWPVVETTTPLGWGWHLDAMCEHLTAVTAGQIRNLCITIPPGCTKSILVSVMWPAWSWIQNPGLRWLCAANEGDLATRDSLSCRKVVQSDWYRRLFPNVQLVSDQNVKTWYQTSEGGHRLATTVSSNVTGKKGDILLCDDPNDAKKVHSTAERRGVQSWWDGAFYDRVNDFKTGRRVIIGQRTHREDLMGYVLATGEFEELRIPEEFVPSKRYITSIGWTDPRTEEGELLRPDRFGPEQVTAAKKKPNYPAKHQQDPKDAEGAKFKAHWLKYWHWDTDAAHIVLTDDRGPYKFRLSGAPLFATCDPAASAKRTADFTVFSVWANTPRGDLIWVDCIRRQVEIPDQPKLLQEVYDKHQFRFIGIEAVASNASMYQFATRMNLNALKCTPKGQDKLTHAQGAIILAEGGKLWLPGPGAVTGFPIEEVANELLSFTGTTEDDHDDALDSLSYACDIRPRLIGSLSGVDRPGSYDGRKDRR